MTTQPDEDATRVQPAAVRDFNAQLGNAWANPHERLVAGPYGIQGQAGPTQPTFVPGAHPAPDTSTYSYEQINEGAAARRAAPPKPRRWPWILAIAAALILGMFAGGGAETSSPASAPAPTATVTTTAEPEVKAVTPKSCIRALNASDKAFGIVSNVLAAVGAAMDGVASFDVDKINAQTAKLKRYRQQLEPVAGDYREYSADCRASR